MKIINNIANIREEIKKIKQENLSIGIVPTMGCIHEAHIALINKIKEYSDIIIVTIFTNPRQFNNIEDYQNYPKTLENDIKKLSTTKTNIIFTPDCQEIYPEDEFLSFKLNKFNNCLCATDRKDHFSGVITIIFKLFNIISPDVAIFGEKDFQQLKIITQAVKAFDFPVKIISLPTLRQENGLAISSRNMRLSKAQQQIALHIFKNLNWIKKEIINGKNMQITIKNAKEYILNAGFDSIEYLAIHSEENLEKIDIFNKNISTRIFIAATINNIRLIDNLKI